jgi:O-antigen/teichoic acid export membrane protein
VSGVLVARLLGADGLGVYGLASAIGQIAYRVADCGMPTILTRLISRSDPGAGSQFASSMAFRLWTGLATVGAVEAFALIVGYEVELQTALLLYTASQLIAGIRELGSTLFYGRQAMGRPAAASAVSRVTAFVVTAAFLIAGLGVIWTILALVLGQAAAAWYLSAGAGPELQQLPVRFSWQGVAPVLRESYPIAVAGIFAMINLRADAVVLSLYVDQTSLGLYNGAYAIVIGLALFPNSFLPALYPALSEQFHVARGAAVSLFLRSQALTAALGLMIAIALALSAPWLMTLLYGTGFVTAGPILAILGWAILCMYISYTNSTFFNAVDRQQLNLWTAVLAGVVNVTANLMLVPRYGVRGAAWATVLSEGVFLVSTSLLVARILVGYHAEERGSRRGTP